MENKTRLIIILTILAFIIGGFVYLKFFKKSEEEKSPLGSPEEMTAEEILDSLTAPSGGEVSNKIIKSLTAPEKGAVSQDIIKGLTSP